MQRQMFILNTALICREQIEFSAEFQSRRRFAAGYEATGQKILENIEKLFYRGAVAFSMRVAIEITRV